MVILSQHDKWPAILPFNIQLRDSISRYGKNKRIEILIENPIARAIKNIYHSVGRKRALLLEQEIVSHRI